MRDRDIVVEDRRARVREKEWRGRERVMTTNHLQRLHQQPTRQQDTYRRGKRGALPGRRCCNCAWEPSCSQCHPGRNGPRASMQESLPVRSDRDACMHTYIGRYTQTRIPPPPLAADIIQCGFVIYIHTDAPGRRAARSERGGYR
eukprot:GHVU01139278.1.p1 GENE.GHVU01139278.1~~GHVU01139278.1.p1  ORF type:complete len:145 (+),score=2.27 GHVU01139278.1:80-514(+)